MTLHSPLRRLAVGSLVLLFAGAAAAQAYPTRPIRLIVPFQAGSAPDTIMRITSQHVARTLGQAIVIDNKAGAQGNIGVAEAARAVPDGYTLVSANNTTFAANPSLFRKLPFDPQKDFVPVARFVTTGLILAVKNDFPAQTLRDFLALVKSQPGKYSAAQASAGMRVSIGMLRTLAGLDVLEVPYKGQPQAVSDLLGGQVSFTFADYAVGLPQIKEGKLRGLGLTAARRIAAAPEIPPIGELVPGFELSVWAGLAAPAGTPPAIVEQLWKAVELALQDSEVRAQLSTLNFSIEPLNPADFAAYIRAETAKWSRIVKDAKIDPE